MRTELLTPKREMYRIAFSIAEFMEAIELFKEHIPTSELTKKFLLQEFKIMQGITKPEYKSSKALSVGQKLGLEDLEVDKILTTPEAKRFKAYNDYLAKGVIGISEDEYELALVHMERYKIPFSPDDQIKWDAMSKKLMEGF